MGVIGRIKSMLSVGMADASGAESEKRAFGGQLEGILVDQKPNLRGAELIGRTIDLIKMCQCREKHRETGVDLGNDQIHQ